MSLYIGNLHPECNEDVLFKTFSLVGEVSSVKVCRDFFTSNSLEYGYVNFSKKEDAEKAIETMNYDMLCGRTMRIMWSQKFPDSLPKSANLVVKNLNPTTDESDLKEIFSSFGDILSIKVARNPRGDSKRYGFVQFAEEEAANWAISALNGFELKGRKLYASKFIPLEERKRFQEATFPNNVYVGNLTTTSSEELAQICEAFGHVMSAKIVTDDKSKSRGYGFVSFKDRESAERAIQELSRLCLNGQRVFASFVGKN